jgi:transcriptional regulator with XRE-family HTH domain
VPKNKNEMYHRALKLIRQYHRLSQIELAEKLDLSKSFLSELETGNKKASIDVLERYANYFRIPLSSLLLFAERTDSSDFGERSRVFAASKVLKMLEWLETTTRDSAPSRRA